MSANHQGKIDSTLQLLELCAKSGANAFKLQTYSADNMTLNSDKESFLINSGPWKGSKLYDLYSEGALPDSWLSEIFSRGRELGITVFSTPFGLDSIEKLEKFNTPAYKIASFELTYKQLLTEIGRTGKPVILSTGLATLSEIEEALNVLKNSGAQDVALLKCTTSYPADLEDLNLMMIKEFQKRFNTLVGFSDHTQGYLAASVAVSQGATILEKHVKLDEDDISLDSSFSLPISNLSDYIEITKNTKVALGKFLDGPSPSEIEYLKYRRSIVAIRSIKKGQVVNSTDVVVVRPYIGAEPKFLDKIVGSVAVNDIDVAQGINLNDVIKKN